MNSIKSKVETMPDSEIKCMPTSNTAVISARGGDTDTSLPVHQLPGTQAAMSANHGVNQPEHLFVLNPYRYRARYCTQEHSQR